MNFNDALKTLRKELGQTQTELANALHTNSEAINRWELGTSFPSRLVLLTLQEYARAINASPECLKAFAEAEANDVKLTEDILATLMRSDYETIATIDATTGEVRNFSGGHLQDVISEQRNVSDNVAGVEAYLRKYCINDDVERVIKETSLPYVKQQLLTRDSFHVAYSLRQEDRTIHKRTVYTYLDKDKTTILCAMQDITELYMLETVRRDQLSSALQTLQEQAGMNVARYDLNTHTFYSNSKLLQGIGIGDVVQDAPEAFITSQLVAPESADELRDFFIGLKNNASSSITAAWKVPSGSYHWLRVDSRLIYDRFGQPYQAILSFNDIDEAREQAAVYIKWRNSLEQRGTESYTLFRCNLSKGASFDKVEGSLLNVKQLSDVASFNERTLDYAGRFVHLDDYAEYIALLNSENLLAGYYRGIHTAKLEYRERLSETDYRWLNVTIEMAQYPNSSDIEVFLMYEPASEQAPAAELLEQLKNDALTDILNRRAFAEHLTALFTSQAQSRHALLLADIDGFKRINDSFGHAVGDNTLVELATELKAAVGSNGFIGRLGGDVFLICLKDCGGRAALEKSAAQLLSVFRRAFSVDIRISASIGIAVFPNDGSDFASLYHNADRALYMAKANGTDSFAFYHSEETAPSSEAAPRSAYAVQTRKPHMLVVDEPGETLDIIKKTFSKSFELDICSEPTIVQSRLRRYGFSLSVIVLNLDIKNLDCLALLQKLRTISEADSVPVTVLSTSEQDALRALKLGANELALMPLSPEILALRIDSALTRAENDRLRAQNNYLQIRESVSPSFRHAYEQSETCVIEYDWVTHRFTYDPAISEHFYGTYDNRSLWQIFMSDMVADVADVKALQEMILGLASSQTKKTGSLDLMLKTPDRTRRWFSVKAYKRVNDRNMTSRLIMTFTDVNDNILAGKKLRFQAEHDSLTGLYNREAFLRLVSKTVNEAPETTHVLFCCNINGFRSINERYGREAGDSLLKYSAEKVLSFTASLGGFAGRLSNDVYALLLPNSDGLMENVESVAQMFFSDYPLKTKISGRVGAYIITDPEMNADAMLDAASTASNSIKGKYGSFLALYDERMNERRRRDLAITERMEAALAADEFDVYLQPQFHHATGKIVGAEALVRWIDPERGVISPGDFIPVFERTGFITQMDEYVWDKAAQYLHKWIHEGNEPVPVSVNVSREDLGDPQFVRRLSAIIEKYDIPINLFRLEITESLFARNTERIVAVVEELHKAGFLVEMDDFGSGYSSLNILKDVPVDILKLDMKFFSGDDNLGRGGMIINAVLRMSRWLNIPVIAEGVEKQDQADFLLSIGCPTIQGYLYEKPMPAREFEKKLSGNVAIDGIPESRIDTALDTHSFWNPTSFDSQVFNNCIGPAAVFEYHNGGYELLRVNVRFASALSLHDSPPEKLDVFKLDESNGAHFKIAVEQAVETGEESRANLRTSDGKSFCICLRVIARDSDRTLIFATLDR